MWYTRNYSELSFLDVPLVFILVNEAMSGVFCLELQTILQFSQLQRRPYYLLLVGSGYYHGIMGRRFPDGGLLKYRKWVPQQLGDVNKQGSGDNRPIGARHGDTAANHTDLQSGCGRTCVFAVLVWSNLWDLIWLRTSHYSMLLCDCTTSLINRLQHYSWQWAAWHVTPRHTLVTQHRDYRSCPLPSARSS